MIVIGLTGNIASGKSEVSKILSSFGAKIIDMDSIGKEIQEQNINDAVNKIILALGSKFYKKGKIDRKALGRYVFSDKSALQKLNVIMIPIMSKCLNQVLDKEKENGTKVVVVDAAILFEAGWNKFADEVWVVYTPENLQIDRLIKRENISEEDARMRINAQMKIEDKINRADFVIDNSGDLNEVTKQVTELWNRIKNSI